MIAPTISGLFISGNDAGNWLRDFIPLLYFFLPVLLMHRVYKQEVWAKWIVISLCTIGLSFSARHFTESGSSFGDVGKVIIFGTNAYFTQDPAVPFAGVFLTCYGIWQLFQKNILHGSLILGLATLPWLAFLGTALRAPLLLSFSAAMMIILFSIYRTRRPILGITILALSILLAINLMSEKIESMLSGSIDLVIQKHDRVGNSGRLEEFSAAIENADTLPGMLFGKGWGGTMPNPTGFGAEFRFTHNVLSYFLLKCGFIGVIFLLIYLWWLLRCFFRSINFKNGYEMSVALASGIVLLIHLGIEPGYKMLPLGILFMLLICQAKSSNDNRHIINQHSTKS